MTFTKHSSSYTALQLVGSTSSEFFFDLSVLYAQKVVQPAGFQLLYVIAYPNGEWSVSQELDTSAQRLSLSEMITSVRYADLVVPHMFCQNGLTSLRILFEDVLNIPVVGSSGHVLQLAQNKHQTKLIAQDLGVSVPKGVRVTSMVEGVEVAADFTFPLIVKPNGADNSDGLNLVSHQQQLSEALEQAFAFSSEVLVEEFIPGRELRGAIIEQADTYRMLPVIEYGVSEKWPIRQRRDKYQFDKSGKLLAQSEKVQVPATCPAVVDDTLKSALKKMMVQLHEGLNCRDFSMYDFRIHEQTGRPYLLEACLFWSFSEASMISSMLRAEGTDLVQATRDLWLQTVQRGKQSPTIQSSLLAA
ncbi:MAG: D-alanine--D-alanine ligase [Bacteroidota bacterium]